MIVLTGATGFLGGAVVAALAGRPLKALCRRAAPGLQARGVAVAIGDLADAGWLAAEIAPGDVVVHMAGRVEFEAAAIRDLHDLHVEGTRRLAEVVGARQARLVLLSSSGTTAVSRHERLIDETAPYPLDLVARWPYYLTKTLQERLVLDLVARRGLDAVVLNPSLLLGPGDDRGGSTDLVREFLERRLPTVPPGGISVVDVRDAARAVASAIDRGRKGERYFLAGHNCRFETFFRVLAAVSGVRGPALRLPGRLATLGARALHGMDVPVPHPARIEMANHFWYADAQKAGRELDFAARPLEATLRDTITYLRKDGNKLA
ncbi:MAG: NAD-dependent epimerase/dehydratase family protein [Candidatus Sericytochromatia bacterium]|nr:NAD-dependent epimerase/dehydratase family protein [Candidatus Tanganyikabacteria bacterium]